MLSFYLRLNSVKHEIHLNYILKFSYYLTVNTQRLHYKDLRVNAV
jgi:hypothetical protein